MPFDAMKGLQEALLDREQKHACPGYMQEISAGRRDEHAVTGQSTRSAKK